jgi:ribonuclease P protein component
MPDFSFKKKERLSSRKTISTLFQSGNSISSFPVRIIYMEVAQGPSPATVAISVPKRLFKKAVDRNVLKRRIREAYRIHKSRLYTVLEEKDCRVNLVIQYHHPKIVDYQTIEEGVTKALDQLASKLVSTSTEINE